LGLTITKLLAQIMGGELSARSTVDVGTTFTVRVALSEDRQSAPSTSVSRRIRSYAGARRKILLVDDDPTHIDIVRELLAPLGFIVLVANNGTIGLSLAEEGMPDLVLLDISMPDVTGWELARRLRRLETLRHTKIIFVSANAHEFSPGGDEQADHDAFLMKPLDIQILLDCIATVLSIEWVYEEPHAGTIGEPTIGNLLLMPIQTRRHMDDLYRLGRIGHVRGIHSKLNELESSDPTTKSFAVHLRKLVANFDLKGYMQALEAMRNHA
jgi:CheY-like chemotaxis protein